MYRSNPQLPTGLAQALYTKFTNLSVLDRITAAPLVLAFSEFDNSPEAWEKYSMIKSHFESYALNWAFQSVAMRRRSSQ